jgi:hypothetical protein
MSIYTSENRIYWAKYDSLLGTVPISSEAGSRHVCKSIKALVPECGGEGGREGVANLHW